MEILENFCKKLEKLTSGNQNPTFNTGKNRIFSGNHREITGKNDLKILYQPCSTYSAVSNRRGGGLNKRPGVGFPPRTFTVLHVIDIVMYDKIIVLGWQKIAKVHTPVYLLLLTSVTSVRFVDSSTGSSEILTALAVELLLYCCAIPITSFCLRKSSH